MSFDFFKIFKLPGTARKEHRESFALFEDALGYAIGLISDRSVREKFQARFDNAQGLFLAEHAQEFLKLYLEVEKYIVSKFSGLDYTQESLREEIRKKFNLSHRRGNIVVLFLDERRQELVLYEEVVQALVGPLLSWVGVKAVETTVGDVVRGSLLEDIGVSALGIDFTGVEDVFLRMPEGRWNKLLEENFGLLIRHLVVRAEKILGSRMANEAFHSVHAKLRFFEIAFPFVSGIKNLIPEKPLASIYVDTKTEEAFTALGLEELLDTGSVRDIEVEIVHKKGIKTHAAISGFSLHDSDGRIQNIVLVAKDLTRLKKYAAERVSRIVPGLEKIAQGDFSQDVSIPPEDDEFLGLVHAVNAMTDNLRDLDKRNKEAEKARIDVERQRSDLAVASAQELEKRVWERTVELQNRNEQVELIRDLSQKLSTSLGVQVAMEHVVDTVRKVFPVVTISYVIFPYGDDDSGELQMSVYAFTDIGEKYLTAVKKDMIETLEQNKDFSQFKSIFLEKNIKTGIVHAAGSQTSPEVPRDQVSVTMVGAGGGVGIVNVSSPEKDVFYDDGMNVVHAVIGGAAQAIERFHALTAGEHSRLGSLVRGMKDGVIMFDKQGRVLVSNPAASKVTGISKKDMSLDSFKKIFPKPLTVVKGEPEEDMKTIIKDRVLSGKLVHLNEVSIGGRFFEIDLGPVLDSDDILSGFAAVIHDITEIREIDQAKTDFVSVASHQMRTPLTSMRWFSEMLHGEEVGKLNDKQKEYLDNIYRGILRTIRLVNELLNVSRLETGRLAIDPQQIYIEDLIESVVGECNLLAINKNCRLVTKKNGKNGFGKKFPKLPLDPNLMRQVILNMVTNAIRYSREDSEVIIELKKVSSRRPELQNAHETSKRKGYYMISVTDVGIGIPKKAQNRIFEKFFRADNAVKSATMGTGLGMYVSKLVAEASGGELWFESEEDKGTIFHVTIPVSGVSKREGPVKLVDVPVNNSPK